MSMMVIGVPGKDERMIIIEKKRRIDEPPPLREFTLTKPGRMKSTLFCAVPFFPGSGPPQEDQPITASEGAATVRPTIDNRPLGPRRQSLPLA